MYTKLNANTKTQNLVRKVGNQFVTAKTKLPLHNSNSPILSLSSSEAHETLHF